MLGGLYSNKYLLSKIFGVVFFLGSKQTSSGLVCLEAGRGKGTTFSRRDPLVFGTQ